MMLRIISLLAITTCVFSDPFQYLEKTCKSLESGDALFTEAVSTKFSSDNSGAKGGFGLVKLMTLKADPLDPKKKNIPVAVKKMSLKIPLSNNYQSSLEYLQRMEFAKYEAQIVADEIKNSLKVSENAQMMRTYSCFYNSEDGQTLDIFLAMERMTSESIDYEPGVKNPGVNPTVIANFHALPISQKLTVLLGVSKQLQVLHGTYTLCHNDIKPSNVMFANAEGSVAKFIDFGGVTWCTHEITVYTEGYVDSTATTNLLSDTQNDIYALGLTFGQIVTGHLSAEIAHNAPIKKMKYMLTSAKFTRHKQVRDAVLADIKKTHNWATEHGDLSFHKMIYKMTKMKRTSRMASADCLVSWLEFLIWATEGGNAKAKDYKTRAAAVCPKLRVII